MEANDIISAGQSFLGLELGSTRIKAVLIGPDHVPLASGSYSWENRWEGGYWTYALDDVRAGLQAAYRDLKADVAARFGVTLTSLAGMGISAMMHGYLPFDRDGRQLAAFRTWRNTTTGRAAADLSQRFGFNIPQRWSISHLYQAMLDGEPHVRDLDYLTTLSGYIHWLLTGRRVLGVGDASGMFPIDSATCDFDAAMADSFDALAAVHGALWRLRDVLPRVLPAGAEAGTLTEAGARLLDPDGDLRPGIPLCPPEGDAGTGMVATNAVAARTGNVSAGTSVFAMIVLEHSLSQVYPEIDLVTTPDGKPVAMVHANNCTNEINAWARMFAGFLRAMGIEPDPDAIFPAMFQAALRGAPDGGGLILYNFQAGEPTLGLEAGRPLLVRGTESDFSFETLMRVQLFAAVASLRAGLEILEREHVRLDRMLGHGGFFKTPEPALRTMAAACRTPVSVMETAGEGGPWGMALLAAYAIRRSLGQSLQDYLDTRVFSGQNVTTVPPQPEDVRGFDAFMERYRAALPLQQAAVRCVQA